MDEELRQYHDALEVIAHGGVTLDRARNIAKGTLDIWKRKMAKDTADVRLSGVDPVALHEVVPTAPLQIELRDWFAGQASEMDIEHYREFTCGSELFDEHFRFTREQARYRYADAMLAARSEGGAA